MMALPMILPHLSPWAGAVAGLRMVDIGMAICVVFAYQPALTRMLRNGFAASGSEVTGGALFFITLGVALFGGYGLFLIVKRGGVPADEFLATRIILHTALFCFNIGFTILFAGMTTRSWLLKGASFKVAAKHGRQAYFNLTSITGVTMLAGAAFAILHP